MGFTMTPIQALLVSLLLITTSSFQQSPTWRRARTKQATMKRNRRLELVSLRATGGSGKKSWTASEFARREEEKSRLERAGDVVIGKTSALAGASDYVLDPKATAEEWMRQASKVEQEVYRQTEEGMEMLKMLRLEEADKAFDRVFELRPEAYLWQAGIAKYYLGDVKAAADIFTRNAATFETKFCEPASEERIWRHACELKIYHTMSKDEKKRVLESGGIESLLPPIPENDSTVELLRSESRKAIRITRELFSASVAGDYSGLILARAKLRSIGGAFEEQPKADRKMWKINAWFYLGLHYDALGKYEESKKCMKMALQLCPSFGNGVDIVHTLPMLHMAQRDWFDDDDFVESWTLSESTEKSKRTDPKVSDPAVTDPVVVESIKVSIAGMKLSELKDALKVRGLKTAASKEELQGRLFQSLMDDTGQ